MRIRLVDFVPARAARAAPSARWTRRLVVVATWLLAVACGLWAALRLSGVDEPWPLPVLLALTPWVVVLAGIALVGAVASRARLAAVVAAAGMLVVSAVVVPRAWGSADRRDGLMLRVMTVNLHVGDGDPATIVRLVRDNRIDLLALQEYTPQARAALSGAGLDALLPHKVGDAEPLAIGSALYARVPLTDATTPVAPGGFVEATATLRMPGAAPVVVRSVHTCAPYTRTHQLCWREGLDQQLRAAAQGPHRLLLGDFNATLDHPPLRRLVDSGYRDAADAVGSGLRPTWPADRLPVITLDHVLADARIGVRAVSVHPVPQTDHWALSATLTLPSTASS